MASVQDIKITEALFINEFDIAEIEALWLSHIKIWGRAFHEHYSPYFPYWLDGLQRCFSCCSLLILLCNRQNIAEYKAYWLMGVVLGHTSHEHILRIFCSGWMDCRDAFHAAFCL